MSSPAISKFLLIFTIIFGLLLSGCAGKSDASESGESELLASACERLTSFSQGLDMSISNENYRDEDYLYRLNTMVFDFTRLSQKFANYNFLDESINYINNASGEMKFNENNFTEFKILCDSQTTTSSKTSSNNPSLDESQSDVSTKETGNNCLKLEVESPYDSADFYAFQVYITNNCSYRVKVAGYFYVKTINGSIYERPSDAMISFHGNNICGLHGNYLNYTFNPGEYSSDSVCNSVHSGDSVVSYFIADNPDGKPILQLTGNWLLN